jgi:hypothetical protein
VSNFTQDFAGYKIREGLEVNPACEKDEEFHLRSLWN